MKGIIKIIDNSTLKKQVLVDSFRKLRLLLFSSFIPLVLFFFYFYSRPNSGNNIFLTHYELIDWLKNIRPIIALNVIIEEVYTKKIFYIISSISIIALYNRISEIKLNPKLSFKNLIKVSDVWLFTSITILFLYFKLPVSDGSAGYVTERLGLLFFIFLIIWLSKQYLRKWFSLIMVAAVLYCHFKLNIYYSSVTKDLNKVAIECNNVSKYILPNSIVLPLNYSDNWLYGHFSNYLGIDKPLIILENYECGTGYFPLKWNEKSIPNTLFGNVSLNEFPCLQWKSNTQNLPVKMDYIFVLGNIDLKIDSCNQKIKQNLFKNYTLTYYSENCKLYKSRNK